MKVVPLFKWFDFWIGFFWDAKTKSLYFFPIPMFGVKLTFRRIQMTKLTKDMFCYRIGFYSAIHQVAMTQNEIDIAWSAYCNLDPNATDAEVELAVKECSDDIIACAGSLKE